MQNRTAPILQLKFWGFSENRRTERIRLHEHTYFQMQFCLSDGCRLEAGGHFYDLKKNDIFLLAPHTPHALSYSGRFKTLTFKFEAQLPIHPPVLYLPDCKRNRTAIALALSILKKTFPRKYFEVEEGTIIMPTDRYPLWMEYFLSGLLADFFRQADRPNRLVQKIHDLLEERDGKPLTVSEAAEACAYSTNHFSVLIHKETGMRAKDFIDRARCEIAKRYLLYSPAPLSEIAGRMGFDSLSGFSLFFKRISGVPPLRYRNGSLP
ncbi:MAG: Multiple antibiotic resistance protein MarA [Lentisphaerae bacterium ADurb.Bin242]|nr:MAG: Multiple antibiotic resistance protein MarA [Lentisphaerae bacterium ADurb.Bin242]